MVETINNLNRTITHFLDENGELNRRVAKMQDIISNLEKNG
jgi:predicted RNase H-like nuclease (RuvC/YqgF family)